MAWKIELSPLALRNLDALDPPTAKRILRFLHERISTLDDARGMGEALKGPRASRL
jgi:mRNA interferase RelE/StbE